MKEIQWEQIEKEKFEFVHPTGKEGSDKPLTKPVGYFQDAWRRFCKNKGSLTAFCIILGLLLFSLLAPIFSPYTVAYEDVYFRYNYPRNELFVNLGLDFWDGCVKKQLNEVTFLQYKGIEQETGKTIVKGGRYELNDQSGVRYYAFRQDTYHTVGCVLEKLTKDEFFSLQEYQNTNGVQIVYPAIVKDKAFSQKYPQYAADANAWYQVEEINMAESGAISGKKQLAPRVERDTDGSVVFDEKGNARFTPAYASYDGTDGYESLRIEGQTPKYNYAVKKSGELYEVRLDYYEYYRYRHALLGDGIDKPSFLLGTTQAGKDVFTCLAGGARLSFLIAFGVSAVNMLVGLIYGSIEGYYGGKLDLFMERFSDILSAVPFIIVITLLKMHLGARSQLTALFIAFFLTGWISMASRVRMQFYRFKNQEYVLAARTLGASDLRIMFKHVLPNSIGTIITGSVLSIPAMIFSESSLSYLGIINLQTGSMTSVGNMLAGAQKYLTSYPYMTLFPALFICLLMLSFNLLGNGLRDAFNPSLRGVDE